MKQLFLLAAFTLIFAGCQPQQPQQPIIVREQAPVVIQQRVVDGCNHHHHCGLYSCNICRANSWHACNAHDYCGHCPACRSHGWGVGVRIGGPRIGIGIGVNP